MVVGCIAVVVPAAASSIVTVISEFCANEIVPPCVPPPYTVDLAKEFVLFGYASTKNQPSASQSVLVLAVDPLLSKVWSRVCELDEV